MNRYRTRTALALLIMGIATLFVWGTSYLPAYAQAGLGDQLRAQMQPLFSAGEGADRVLTSNWETLVPGEVHVYRFDYNGGEQPMRVWLTSLPAGAVQFQIWTDVLMNQLNDDPELGPVAAGAPISDGSEFSIWQGNTPEPHIYWVTVSSSANDTVQYLLNISSPGLAEQQPGLGEPTPIPPTITPTPVGPTATPLPNVTVVPVATQDPNLAVVVAAALNVRSGPSTAYPVITTVPAGTVLTVLGRNEFNTWIAVRLEDGTEGWVTRSLTNYIGVAETILVAEPLPTATPLPGVTATPTPDTSVVVVQPPTPEALDGDWKVIREGETHWYTFQYRGGGLPVHVWMDVEPDKGAIFNILNRQTAQAILAGVAPNVVNAIGRGTSNPVEPGYSFWRADFPEADVFYVMVQWTGPGDVVYAVHAAGPGLGRPVLP